MEKARVVNGSVFLLSVIVTGALAGALVWLILFVMDVGIGLIWDGMSSWFGRYFPIPMCIVGGLVIGLFARRYGEYPEDLRTVMSKVKRDGRYGYDKLGRMSVAAVLPLVFGGSVGPEAGLTGVIAGLCSWVGDRMKRFGRDFRELSEAGVTATLSALFTAPLYGFAAGVSGSRDEDGETLFRTKWGKAVVYACAVVGAMAAIILLNIYVGGGMALPHYDWVGIGTAELVWIVPLIIVGSLAGWLFCVFDAVMAGLSKKAGDRLVLKPVVAGAVLGMCGVVLPFTMFAGETQAIELGDVWMEMGAALLIVTGVVKILVTAMCVNMGWRGGHFFPIIFSGIAIGYGMAIVADIDTVFSICVVTAALVGGVMRKPLMAVLLLFLCFPLIAFVPMIVAAFVGSRVPLPKKVGEAEAAVEGSGPDTQ